jgi:hypothetical protein
MEARSLHMGLAVSYWLGTISPGACRRVPVGGKSAKKAPCTILARARAVHGDHQQCQGILQDTIKVREEDQR